MTKLYNYDIIINKNCRKEGLYITITDIKQNLKEMYGEDYSLLSTEYINAKTKMKFKHNVCGNEFEMRYDAFFGKQRQQCPNPQCVKKRIETTNLLKFGTKNPFKNKEVRQKMESTMIKKYGTNSFFKNGLIQQKMKERYGIESSNQLRIDKKYVDILHNRTLLKEWKQNFKNKNNRIPNINDFSEESGYDITNIYKIIKENNWNISDFFDNTSSSLEQLIANFLNENNIEFILHNREIIPPLELDFFIPNFNIAIEINGICCHASTPFLQFKEKDKRYHQHKSLLCEKNGIRLIHIFEWELNQDYREKIFNYLRNVFDINIIKIYARKCTLKEIKSSVANEFYNKYHLQGRTSNTKYNYGLYYNDELVSCMSFSFTKQYFILSRFCSKARCKSCWWRRKII